MNAILPAPGVQVWMRACPLVPVRIAVLTISEHAR